MALRTFILFAAIFMALLLRPVNAIAEDQIRSVDFGAMKQSKVVEVASVIDPLTVQLTDGRLIRLSGIEFPDMGVNDDGPYAILALTILKDLLNGQTVYLYQTADPARGRENRMGEDLAQIEVQGNKIWVQGMLLSLGLARVRTTADNPDMALPMYTLEAEARARKDGLWAEDAYRILKADEAAGFEKSARLVEGRVVSTAMVNNQVYLNFGPDWRTDFTVSIASEDKHRFLQAGIDPLQLGGKFLRVRGWIDSYNGPYIKIDHPEALEIMEEGK